MTKCTSQIVSHVPESTAKQFKALAEVEGTTPSEYMRELIESHLAEKRTWFEGMQKVFGGKQNDE